MADTSALEARIRQVFRDQLKLEVEVEPGALAQQGLRRGRIIPQLGVLRLGVQLGEAAVGHLPVKDASSAAPATF